MIPSFSRAFSIFDSGDGIESFIAEVLGMIFFAYDLGMILFGTWYDPFRYLVSSFSVFGIILLAFDLFREVFRYVFDNGDGIESFTTEVRNISEPSILIQINTH